MARLTKSKDDGEISVEEFEAANRAGAARRARGVVTSARFFTTGRRLSLRLSTGVTLIVPVDQIEGLSRRSNEALRDVLIGPGGLSVHFPQLDADISAVGLLDGVFGSPSWMAHLSDGGEPAGEDGREMLAALASHLGTASAALEPHEERFALSARRFAGGDAPPTVHSMPADDISAEEALAHLRAIVSDTVEELARKTKPAPVSASTSKPSKRAPRSKAKP